MSDDSSTGRFCEPLLYDQLRLEAGNAAHRAFGDPTD